MDADGGQGIETRPAEDCLRDLQPKKKRTRRAPRPKRTLAELLEASGTRPLLNPEEMAARLNVGLSTAYRLLASGVIPVVKIPGTSCVRVRASALDSLLLKWEHGGRRRARP